MSNKNSTITNRGHAALAAHPIYLRAAEVLAIKGGARLVLGLARDRKICPVVPGQRFYMQETLRHNGAVWTYGADNVDVSVRPQDQSRSIAWAHHFDSDVCRSTNMPEWASRFRGKVTSVSERIRLRDVDAQMAVALGVTGGTFREFWRDVMGKKHDPKALVWAIGFELDEKAS